ncbi:signal-regulatory protein beta-2-like isoform X3 [Takifugu rubripes]|uniref:signal-regulatory protein beta-2-like isoform X3 n=1 Tax=Takifugu rubripes TaxID=31033 RepID=UPI001145F046|nr:signal-regulatory protein beta-2-like isoform X3 [Takifugu rubripes]
MKLLLVWLSLASLCPLSSWSIPSVVQTPDISVTEGETLTISCCWTLEAQRYLVNWVKNGTIVKKGLIKFEGSLHATNCSNFTFTNISQENSGRYRCRVRIELPGYTVFEGKGTVITVRAKSSSDTAQGEEGPTLLLPLVVSLLLLLLVLVLLTRFCLWRRKQALAARVIYEVPHCDSDLADVDKRSTGSSAGSSQWCQVMVYESVDYFEGLQSRETK